MNQKELREKLKREINELLEAFGDDLTLNHFTKKNGEYRLKEFPNHKVYAFLERQFSDHMLSDELARILEDWLKIKPSEANIIARSYSYATTFSVHRGRSIIVLTKGKCGSMPLSDVKTLDDLMSDTNNFSCWQGGSK